MAHTFKQVQDWYNVNIVPMLKGKNFGFAPNQGLGKYSEERFFEEMQSLVDQGFEIIRFKESKNHYYYCLQSDLSFYIKEYELVKPTPTYEPVFHYANDYVYGMAMQQA